MASRGLCQLPDDIVAAVVLRAFRSSGATLQAHLNMSLVCRCGRVIAALYWQLPALRTGFAPNVLIRRTILRSWICTHSLDVELASRIQRCAWPGSRQQPQMAALHPTQGVESSARRVRSHP